MIHSDFFFNKDLEYLRYGRKSGRHALSISKIKAAYWNKRPKRKPKAQQNQARNGKNKVKGHPSEENIT
ncbi:hypothetical protein Tco_0739769 [Tanacetum coccineum]